MAISQGHYAELKKKSHSAYCMPLYEILEKLKWWE